MTTTQITIRRAVAEDAAGFAALMGDEHVFPSVLQMPYATEAMWRDRLSGKPNEGDLQLVAIRDGQVIGQGGLFGQQIMRRRHACVIGMAVKGNSQGQGIGSALMKALTEYADQWTPFSRLELTVYTDNAVGIALYRKFGFEQEGLLRNYALQKGHYVDALTMARLRPDADSVERSKRLCHPSP